jgi:Holliday junction resolvasome RuvABC endonuclease subunit
MSPNPTRIFALDPTTKGFGYAVFEQPMHLVEWGCTRAPTDKHASAIAHFEKLLARFRPDAVVLEDVEAPGSRRRHRARRLIGALTKLARERDIPVHLVARTAVLACFSSPDEPATKYSIATRLTQYFHELAPHLPPPRDPWQSEDERMAVFDALALALTYTRD